MGPSIYMMGRNEQHSVESSIPTVSSCILYLLAVVDLHPGSTCVVIYGNTLVHALATGLTTAEVF